MSTAPDQTLVNSNVTDRYFFVVLARDRQHVEKKIEELESIGASFIIVCGERFRHPNVVFREAFGKWDAINYAAKFLPIESKVIIFNDVDTTIHNLNCVFKYLDSPADLIYCRVQVPDGPQVKFYDFLTQYGTLPHCGKRRINGCKEKNLPKSSACTPCIAEDSYILFKALELGYHAHFCREAYVTTKRTSNHKEEERYKGRTTLGIYQALGCTKPPLVIRIFYLMLPLFAPLLAFGGKDGAAWAKGINKAVKANLTKKQVTKF
jgi:hypothetical protein